MSALFKDQLDGLIDLIYQMPSDSGAWERFSKKLLHLLDASYVHIQAIDFKYNVLSFSHGVGNLAQEFYAQAELNYLHFPAEADPRWPVFLHPDRQGWYQCHTHVSKGFVQSSDLYQQILLPVGLRYVASHILMRDEKLCVFWSISTSAERQPLNADELRFLDSLLVHLKRAVSVQRQKYEFEAQSIAGFALIDKLPQPIMLLNLSGQAIHCNPAMRRVLEQGRWLSVQPDTKQVQLLEGQESRLEELLYHFEFLLRRQISDQLLNERSIQMVNDNGQTAYLFLSLLLSKQEQLIFGTRPLMMLNLFQPNASVQHEQLFKIFDCFTTGVILLTHDQQVFYQNAYAEQLLEKTSLLSISKKRLRTGTEFQDKLSHLLNDVLQNSFSYERNLAIYGKGQHEILSLNISLIDQGAERDAGGLDSRIIAVFFKQLNQKRELEEGYLRQLYQLTRRELQICMLFFQGMDLNEIAEHMHLTLSTVRTYLKQIYIKTHCSSQSELMKLLMNAVID